MGLTTDRNARRNLEDDSIAYRLKLYQIRSRLQSKGVLQPVKEMIEQGLIEKSPENGNFLLGRIINIDFLEAIEKFDNLITNQS